MNKTLVTLLSGFLLLSVAGCTGDKNKAKTDGRSQDTSSTSVDYTALHEKALKFVPEIGKSGGQMVLSTFSDPKSFNPITSTENSTTEFTQYMYEGLTRSNGVTLMPEPNLSDTWEISSDGLTFTFHIRSGVIWSDSVPFSAYDVEFTFNDLIYNMSISPNSSRDIFTMEGKRIAVKALDSAHVEFKLPFTYAPFLRALNQEILPKHKYAAAVRKGAFSTALGIQTPADQMVGTGPYMLESYTSSQKVIFKRNPHYWKKDSAGNRLPYIDRIVYTIVADQNAELLQFKSGEVDYLLAKGEDYPGLKKDQPTGNYSVYRVGPATGSNFLIFNQNSGIDPKTKKPYVDKVRYSWFTSTKFRQAIAYALDKSNMINIVMNGLGYPQWSPMAPSEGYYFNGNVSEYPYNINKAKEILSSEGFKDTNGDGTLEDKDGNAVEFSFVTNSGNNTRLKIAEIIRKDIESLGIKVHFQQLEFNSLVQKLDNPPYEWDAILIGLTGSSEPHFGRNVWHSSGTMHMWNESQKTPATPWEATIDSIYDAGVKELDTAKRKALYDRWQQIASEQLPFIYTVLPERILCITNKFGNLNPCPNGGLLHNLEYIYVK